MVRVTIVGGGPAGSALAIGLGRRGVHVLLLEKAHHPRPKACGEGLLPQGVEALKRLGVPCDFPTVRGLRFVAPSGHSAVADFPGTPGMIVSRERFDERLFRAAAATPNVEAVEGFEGAIPPSDVIVGADGLQSMFHGRAPFHPRRSNRLGQSAHIRREMEDRVEVRFLRDGEMYLAPCGPGEALVASLGTKFVPLRDRLPNAEFTTPILSRAPLGMRMNRVVHGNVLLIGDAAGAPDPITGEGMSMALIAAEMAAEVIAGGRPLAEYESARLAMGENAHRFGTLLRRLSGHPVIADRVIDALSKDREALDRLVQVAVGKLPVAKLGIAGLIRRIIFAGSRRPSVRT